ncbi:hypothetical protein ACFY41_08345 [Streptomyces syringium]|uniref:Uncharacterized protein n=1 Tax=Streptomyces syringium TaxID=76729 RepID=A0ABS4YDE4_9ACTN|nr:hypothetical protein [Streptomyces syringium]MBP2406822.1 hypothetical protein [Streptomyces syringium]SPE61941.1 hypothetical protein SNS2_4263 [Streptomyces netropsis]
MTHAVDVVEAAAIALHQGSWIPSGDERALGQAFFSHRAALEQRLLPGMPASQDPQGWVTQHVLWLQDAAALADQLVAQWYAYLPGSYMTALLAAYADRIRPVLPLAARLHESWEAERPEPLTQETVAWWEEWHVPAAERKQLDELTHQTIIIGSVLITAVGDN